MRTLFRFPDPVNETSARVVAAGVVAEVGLFLVTGEGWLLVVLIAGFLARVLTGPTLSPLGQFATRVATPLLERHLGVRSKRVPGPPKRFAQGIGLTFSVAAGAAWLAGWPVVAIVVLAVLVTAATLEAAFAVCLGCIAHSAIWGCAGCTDIGDRLRMAILEAQRPAPTA